VGVQTGRVINGNFVFVGIAISLTGGFTYIRDTLRGVTSPNRVTWSLWAIEGLLAFVAERQQHVGLASFMTLFLGLVPLVVVVASFRDRRSYWKIGRFDVACGIVSIIGILFWAVSNHPTVALVTFVAADSIAGLPTLRKAFVVPASETAWNFLAGSLNGGITLLTLSRFTTAGALFPLAILVMDLAIGSLVVSKLGPRVIHSVRSRSMHGSIA